MVYKASPENLTIGAFCWDSSEHGIEVLEKTGEEENGWLFYTFPVLQNLTFWEGTTKCGIEISGNSDF